MFMPHRLGLFVFYFHGVFRLSRIVQLHDEARVLGGGGLVNEEGRQT